MIVVIIFYESDLRDVCRSHSSHQSGEPLIRHKCGQQRLGAGGGHGDRGQDVGGAPSHIHRGGQRGSGSVNRVRGVMGHIGGGVLWTGRSVFNKGRGIFSYNRPSEVSNYV